MTILQTYEPERGYGQRKMKYPVPEMKLLAAETPPTQAEIAKPAPLIKTCSTCKTTFLISEFKSKTGKKSYSQCLECRRKAAKRRMRERLKYTTIYVREYIISFMGNKCARCGYQEFSCALEFHHTSPQQKTEAITRLINQFCYGGTQTQWDTLITELRKCLLLCSNCHQSLHIGAWSNMETIRRRTPAITTIPLPLPP